MQQFTTTTNTKNIIKNSPVDLIQNNSVKGITLLSHILISQLNLTESNISTELLTQLSLIHCIIYSLKSLHGIHYSKIMKTTSSLEFPLLDSVLPIMNAMESLVNIILFRFYHILHVFQVVIFIAP